MPIKSNTDTDPDTEQTHIDNRSDENTATDIEQTQIRSTDNRSDAHTNAD
jgi:hypothetical protein